MPTTAMAAAAASPVDFGEVRSGLAAAVVHDTVYLAGGHSGESPLKLFEAFEPSGDPEDRGDWKKLEPLLARRAYCSAAVHGDSVFIIGGSADGRSLNTIEVYDSAKREWADWYTRMPMHVKRTLHQSCVAKGRLFVCGGFDGMRDLASMEELDLTSHSWKWSTQMERPRSYFALCSCGDDLYAIGGQDRRGHEDDPRAHSSVDRFELFSELWFPAAPLLRGRVGCAAATLLLDGKPHIFVCGGSDGSETLTSMERYDPVANAWVEVAPMSQHRLGHAVAVVENRLYAIGGFDGKEPLGNFECYDPDQDRWTSPAKMGASLAVGDE
mmetsp:Transcript_75384/g.157097  ORF Transcript_75384/g.157097 Transcript_75384/m.157097 type:complete len:326 (-) Transcript_75384:22-999(-)